MTHSKPTTDPAAPAPHQSLTEAARKSHRNVVWLMKRGTSVEIHRPDREPVPAIIWDVDRTRHLKLITLPGELDRILRIDWLFVHSVEAAQ